MNGPRTTVCVAVLLVPFCLLLATACARATLARPWALWQPPVTEPWMPGAKAPPPERVGRTWFGDNLHDPAVVLARTHEWGTVAAVTLLGVGFLLLLLARFRELPAKPSGWTGWFCGALRLMLRVWPLFGALYAVELIAACYFFEVLTNGGVTFVTPAMAAMILFGTTAYHFRVWRSVDPALPARLNARLLDRRSQPELIAELDDVAMAIANGHVARAALMLEPQFTLAAGPIACGGETVDGYIPLIALPLLHCLTLEEFRALAAQMLAPFTWTGGPHADRIYSVHEAAGSLSRRLGAPFQDAPFDRLSAFVPALGFCVLALQPADGHEERIADLVSECDRIAAARFGSRDLARGLLKQQAVAAVWPAFRLAMASELKSLDVEPESHPYERIAARLAISMTTERTNEVLAQIPPELRERLAHLGYSEFPEIDCFPPESAAALLVDAEGLDRELSASERAYFVLEAPRRGARKLQTDS